MTDALVIAQAIYRLAEAVDYLAGACCTLSIVGLVGYYVALRSMKEERKK